MLSLPFLGLIECTNVYWSTMGAHLNTNKIFVLVKETADDDGWFICIYMAYGINFLTRKAEIDYLSLLMRYGT